MQFEWDLEKADENVRKHGVSFEEAMSVFGDSLARIHSDPDHSEAESREVICGHTAAGRLLLVFFTEKSGNIRLFSAREATTYERKDYEENE